MTTAGFELEPTNLKHFNHQTTESHIINSLKYIHTEHGKNYILRELMILSKCLLVRYQILYTV